MTQESNLKTQQSVNLLQSTNNTPQDENVDSSSSNYRLNASDDKNVWSAIELRAKEFPKAYRSHYLKAMSGKSRQSAIRSNCLMCMGYNSADVEKCSAKACPLYPYRLRG